jgi:hypothetical protein
LAKKSFFMNENTISKTCFCKKVNFVEYIYPNFIRYKSYFDFFAPNNMFLQSNFGYRNL